ncbi:MAG: hypothetical protein FJ249_08470 [Nitrospira sp.]|nr:hypothetical protein [Nitrospira sp.]
MGSNSSWLFLRFMGLTDVVRRGLHMLRPVALALLLIGLPVAQWAHAADGEAVETVGSGTVNWTTGLVTATGVGAPPAKAVNPAQARAMAERAAYSAAVRNLLETVKGVRVDSAVLVENMVVANDVIKTRVTGLVKGARQLKVEHQPDGMVEVTVAVSLTGELVDVVLPKEFGRPVSGLEPTVPAKPAPRPLPPSPPVSSPERAPSPPTPTAPSPALPPSPPPPPAAAPAPPAPSSQAAPSYTGLIVDARGLNLKPALAPRLLDDQGKELYAGGILTREQAVEAGVAGYAKDMVAGSRQSRVTDNPLIVKGVRVSGTKGTDVVLNADAVKAIQQSEPTSRYLQQARVVMVYD